MLYQLPVIPAFLLISLALLVAFWVGTRIRSTPGDPEKGKSTFYVEGTLLSLLISLTFSLSASKYDKRRGDFNHEINTISTSIYRTAMLPDSTLRFALRSSLQSYLENRIAYYDVGDDQARIDSIVAVSDSIAKSMFQIAAEASHDPAHLAFTQQMIPALNAMFDAAGTREIFRNARIPLSVIRLLVILSMVVAFLQGTSQDKANIRWVPALGYTVLIAMSFALIIDFGHNRTGQINLDKEQLKMIQLRELFDE